MHILVRKTLEIYLREKRIIAQSEIPSEFLPFMAKKEAVFVTLYYEGRIIASSGRIQCQKENMIYECIDNTLLCLKDSRFTANLQSSELLANIHIRVDTFASEDRRLIPNISDLSIRDEGLIFLSQNLGIISVILPRMVYLDPTPQKYLEFACQKAGVNPQSLTPADYVLYAIRTKESTDMA